MLEGVTAIIPKLHATAVSSLSGRFFSAGWIYPASASRTLVKCRQIAG